MQLVASLISSLVWLMTISHGAAQQLCYNLNEPGTPEFYYACKGQMILPCSDKNTIDNAALQTDCTDVDSSQFGGGSATTNFCYPSQKRASVCGTPPNCPSKGLFPISQGMSCNTYLSCQQAGGTGVVQVCGQGLNYNPVTQRCESFVCGSRVCKASMERAIDLNSCNAYLKCSASGQSWTSVHCILDWRYSPLHKFCKPAILVQCQRRPITR